MNHPEDPEAQRLFVALENIIQQSSERIVYRVLRSLIVFHEINVDDLATPMANQRVQIINGKLEEDAPQPRRR